jgi:hypothetical protein
MNNCECDYKPYFSCKTCCYSTTSWMKAEKHEKETGHDVEEVMDSE